MFSVTIGSAVVAHGTLLCYHTDMPGTVTDPEQILYGRTLPRLHASEHLVEEMAVIDAAGLRRYLHQHPALQKLAFDLDDLYLDDLLESNAPTDEMLKRIGNPVLDPEYFSPATRTKIIVDVIASAGEEEYGVVLTVLYRHLCQWVLEGDQDHKQLVVRYISSVHNYAALGDLARRVHALTHDR